MREKRPYISIEKDGNNFRVHALILLEPGYELVSPGLVPDGIKRKSRNTGPAIICNKFLIEIADTGATVTDPQHLVSSWHPRPLDENGKLVDHIWVHVKSDFDSTPEDGSVGNYDDPDQ